MDRKIKKSDWNCGCCGGSIYCSQNMYLCMWLLFLVAFFDCAASGSGSVKNAGIQTVSKMQ